MSAKEVEKADTPAADSSDSSGLLSGKITAILVLVYVVTIVLGGVIFSFIESPNEETVVTDSVAKVNQFLSNNTCLSPEDLQVFIQEVIAAYDAGVTMSNDTESHESSWDIVSSVFFCTTIVTTIGYGNISPSGPGGRVFAVFYALIGIPLFVVVSGQLGMRLSSRVNKLTARALKNMDNEKWKSSISFVIVFLIGFCIYMLLGAGIFSLVEKWTYAEALYYTFISLTTIGFGDYVPGFANGLEKRSAGSTIYRMFLTGWIIMGLVWMASSISAVSEVLATFAQSPKTKDRKTEPVESKEGADGNGTAGGKDNDAVEPEMNSKTEPVESKENGDGSGNVGGEPETQASQL